MIKLEKLTDEELADFTQRACVQLCPELTVQLMSIITELADYRAKEGSFEFKLAELSNEYNKVLDELLEARKPVKKGKKKATSEALPGQLSIFEVNDLNKQ